MGARYCRLLTRVRVRILKVVCAAVPALHLVSSIARHAPCPFALAHRDYAEAADKIKLSLVLPHQVCFLAPP
jgi:hypothetical protein